MRFVDTNVLLYAVSSDPTEVAKSARAIALLQASDLALSVQVLQEFYVQATRTSRSTPLGHDAAVSFLTTLERFPIQDLTLPIVRAALDSARRWRIGYWDAAIVEAARAVGCDQICSEDLSHGQDFGGVRVVNPFT
jgi:predicted nucleic acid-binding protein